MGRALTLDPVGFAIKCVELSVQRFDAAAHSGKRVFFDRSLIDAVSALVHEEPNLSEHYLRILGAYRYADTVLMAAPWSEKFENDAERKHIFEVAVAEYDRLVATYTLAGYSIRILPKVSVPERVDFVLRYIE